MHLHILQHVPFEGPACISDWCSRVGLEPTLIHMYQGDALPAFNDVDMLCVLGGPMSVNDTAQYPWLDDERALIHACIDADKTVLGLCLGAQQIASCLGASIRKNENKEVGWFNVRRDAGLAAHPLARILPENFNAFHWHGETFSLPDGAQAIGSSEACANQGFVYHDKVIALQFHLETSLGAAGLLIKNCHDDLNAGSYSQSEDDILARPERFTQAQQRMYQLLDYLLEQTIATTR